MSKILRCLAGLFILCFIGNNAFAAGYNCPTYRKYTSCNSGYYISECDGSSYRNGELMELYDLSAGNSCKSCPSGYLCSGGLVCPKKGNVTCSAGTYLKSNTTSCSTCEAGYRCPGGTFNISSSIQGRYACSATDEYQNSTGQSTCKTVSNGYYKNGNTAQRVCGLGYWCINGVRTACSTLGTGYTTSITTAYRNTSCYLSVNAGYVRNGTTGTTLTRCAAGTYRAAHNAYYGTSYSCLACSGRTKYSAAGAGSCSTVSTGYYTTGCNTSGNNCTGQSRCSGATYCTSGVQYNCPTADSGWTRGTGTGWSGYGQCFEYRNATSISSYCASGQLRRYASSATEWAPTASEYTTFRADPGAYVSGSGINMTCTRCSGFVYSPGGDVHSCTACPTTLPVEWRSGSGTGWDGGVIAFGVAAKPGAILDSKFQNGTLYVEDPYKLSSLCKVCSVGSYSPGGDVKECTACLDNYTTSGTALTDHDSASDCKIYCDGGSYIAVANATQCSNVGAGYWAPSSTIPQGSVGSRTACESGLTTIGFGAGADESGDCGRVLNVGDEKIYLRSTKKTTPSLNISINGDVFYGNMSTATRGALRINSGGTTYSVYDDSM